MGHLSALNLARRERGLLLVTAAALAVRLVWNLGIHRPFDFNYSDMGGYLFRAQMMFDRPPRSSAGWWLAFFPYGTHYFIHAAEAAFGRRNGDAVGAAFAFAGAGAVAYTYATAARYCTSRWAVRAIGLVLIFYYPWISFGGYAMSETPFACCIAASAFYGLRLADTGRARDAWLLGVFLALGTTVRPQILLAVVFLALHALIRRQAWKALDLRLALRAAAPIALILVLSAFRMHGLTDRWGLVSTNGPMNFAFGRCHNASLESFNQRGRGAFRPPGMTVLAAYEKDNHPFLRLDPVLEEQIKTSDSLDDGPANNRRATLCIKRAGLLREARFALTHVVLLWAFNDPWPDSEAKPEWSVPMTYATDLYDALFLVPGIAAMILALGKTRARSMVLAVYPWSMVATAALYFGEARQRVPYDGVLIVLGVELVFEVGRRAWGRLAGKKAAPVPGRAAATV